MCTIEKYSTVSLLIYLVLCIRNKMEGSNIYAKRCCNGY